MKKSIKSIISLVLMLLCLLAHKGQFASAASIDYDSLRRFSQVLDIVEQYYVEETKQSELIDGAIKGMLESLDPHSTFMDAKEFELLQESTSGEFFGIGAELSMSDGRPVVIAPIEGTPAQKAGIKSGDIIFAVDGKLTLDRSLTETVSFIRGEKGTKVELVILPKDEQKTKTITITRGVIPYISVRAKEIEPGYEWIRLSFFNDRTTTELKDAIKAALKKGPIKGIILDLRNNPGGILNEAATVSDLFLDKGTIVSIRGREGMASRRFSAKKNNDDMLDVPIVVLINSGSASASEIVAGALSDNKRAVLLGETSFGKGSVQNLIPLPDGTGIKITIALYYTPNGTSIQAQGIEPNYDIDISAKKDEVEEASLIVREKDLNSHLEQGTSSKKETQTKKFPAPKLTPLPKSLNAENKKLLENDNQLRTALQVLKNMPTL